MVRAISNQQSAISKVLLCWLLLFSTGCIRQQLVIRSEPEGAKLLLNDKHAGTTPYTDEFLWYGWYRITLMKPGYERLDDLALIKASPNLWIPLDLIVELLPFPVWDTKVLSYQLVPQTPLPEPTPPALSVPAPHPEKPANDQDQ